MTHYQTLKVPPSATVDEIRRAYRHAAWRLHPDRNPGDKEAERQFKEISAAYTVLIDPVKRQQYDRKIQPPRVSAGPRPGCRVHGFRRAMVNGVPVQFGFPGGTASTAMHGGVNVVINGVPMPGFRSFTVQPTRPDNTGGTK